MPNRIVRDGINRSKAIDQLDWAEENFYRRLITEVDDFGRIDADTAILKAALYPRRLDRVREADITRWMAACHKAGVIVLYEFDAKPLLVMLKFEKPRAQNSKYPQPPEGVLCWRRGGDPKRPVYCTQMSAYDNVCAQMRTNANPYPSAQSNSQLGENFVQPQPELPFPDDKGRKERSSERIDRLLREKL